MNSKNILKILAVLLVFVNVILLIMVLSVYKRRNFIDESYLNNTYSILAKDNVSIKNDAIPHEKLNGYIYSASLDEDYYETVASNLTGEDVATRFLFPGGYSLTTVSGKSMEFSDGYKFKYSVSEIEDCGELSKGDGEVSFRIKNKLSAASEKFLSAGDEGFYPCGVEIKDIYPLAEEGKYAVVIVKNVEDVSVYEQEVTLVFDQDQNVLCAFGVWCFYCDTVRYSSQIYDQVNILFIEKADRLEDEVYSDIIKVVPKYIIYSNTETSSVFLVPAWQIMYADGTYKIYDAESGNLNKASE